MQLTDLVAIVTGGSSGIGLATVEALLEEGARVVTCGRDANRLARALQPLADAHPGRLAWQGADVLQASETAELVRFADERFGGVDLVVNNAGRSLMADVWTTTPDQWHEEFELKIGAVLNVVNAARPALARSRAGAIVNLNAVLARQPETRLAATSAARAALLNLSTTLARELASDGVRLNSVCVGLIDTGQWSRRHAAQAPDQPYEEYCRDLAEDRGISLGRLGTAAEVAAAIVFLLSPRAAYVTGTDLEISGGVARYV